MRTAIPQLSDDFLKKAVSIASYYGFVAADSILSLIHGRRGRGFPTHYRRDPFTHSAYALLEACTASRPSERRPLFLYHLNLPQKRRKGTKSAEPPRFGLSIVGVERSVAEALVLRAATAILEESGLRAYCVHINSIGDKDSTAKFVREATCYIRKHLNSMPISFQTAFKRDIFNALAHIAEREHPLHDGMPRPMQFLSDASRRHLREVLEYLETIEVPYRIDDTLVGHKDCYTQVLYEIRTTPSDDDEMEVPVARGGRCDEMSRRLFRTTLPAVGIVIEGNQARRRHTLPKAPSRTPKVYLIQVGFGAKLTSLPLIETLRKARIPLHQSIDSDQLDEQLTRARAFNTPYVLIIGQREAIEQTAILRDMGTQAQQTVPLSELPTYLKKL